MKRDDIEELIFQALETELGGVRVYTTAIGCALNEDLKQEWEKYLEQTTRHVEIMEEVCEAMGLDPNKETAGRAIVRFKGEALVTAMTMALKAGNPVTAELVACECVVDAETKDHQNWTLMSMAADALEGEDQTVLADACEEVEEEEDEHLYHTMGWCRELWIQSMGLPAQLPPPEEEKNVKSAIGAAKAKQSRTPTPVEG
jgi:hypothetical protein